MQVYLVITPDGGHHYFSDSSYANIFADYYRVRLSELTIDLDVDMTLIKNISEWQLFVATQLDHCYGGHYDKYYILAKTEKHALEILKAHGESPDNYYVYVVDLSDIVNGTTLEQLLNFDKKE